MCNVQRPILVVGHCYSQKRDILVNGVSAFLSMGRRKKLSSKNFLIKIFSYLRDSSTSFPIVQSYLILIFALIFFFFFFNFIYFLGAALGLCFAWTFSSCSEWGLSFIVLCRLLIVVASLGVEHRLQTHGLSTWAHRPQSQAQQLWPTNLVAQQHVESSRSRDQTHVPCIGRQILIHFTTRKVLPQYCFRVYCRSATAVAIYLISIQLNGRQHSLLYNALPFGLIFNQGLGGML